jgi:hypothetical protein
MKQEIFDILYSDDTMEGKLDSIEELVLTPNRLRRRQNTQRFRRAAEILSRMMNDYQFNPLHDDYCGMLNTSDEGFDKDDFAFLVDGIKLFEPFIEMNGFKVEKATTSEFILLLANSEEKVQKPW